MPEGVDSVNFREEQLNPFSHGTKFTAPSAAVVNNASGFQLDFSPVSSSFSFDLPNDCKCMDKQRDRVFKFAWRQTIQLYSQVFRDHCLRDDRPKWSVCRSKIFKTGLCFHDTSFQWCVTTVYDSTTYTILTEKTMSSSAPASLDPNILRLFNERAMKFSTNDTANEKFAKTVLIYQISLALRFYQSR